MGNREAAKAKEDLARAYLSRINDDPGNGDWRPNTLKLVKGLRKEAEQLRRKDGKR